ncbi:SoxH- like protein [Thioalkalivibrio nitratireducens DSM 14787]|uniref:SoxH-like protein n=1 Tax=Thioalkalivibrio nitratireducens (strain DSM 14787 / UNIQEM 213 / ALEN2) TaxID=1255043 RepID=L0E076_THIND|nr:MBL fold metallo-hydrolase [Thioalkalivibrio nitratireducens]AGA34610.1 SoxH- like protein [Thioalkalivibrio nitratireducens DSM 14787]
MSVRESPYTEVTVDTTAHAVEGADTWYVIGLSGIPSSDNQGHTSNAGFVTTGEGVVVYDALGTPALGFELIRRIREVTDEPIRYVIAGHYHADHIYGLQAFADHTDAHIIAQRRAEDYLDSETARQRLAQRRDVLFPWIDEDTRVIHPDTYFDAEHRFSLGNKTFRLLHAGPAHSPDDVIMVVEETGVVFAGDIVFDGRLPFLGDEDVNTVNWIQRLDMVQEMRPSFLIPGHGEATAQAARAVSFTRGYLQDLRDQMGAAVQDFLSFDEAFDGADWSQYRGLPAFDETHRRNANAVFLEIESEMF